LSDTVTGNTGLEFRRHVIQDQPPFGFDFDDLAAPMEFPGKGFPVSGIAGLQAFVVLQVMRAGPGSPWRAR